MFPERKNENGDALMGNTLIPGMLGFEFEALAKRKAKIADQENKLMEKIAIKTNDQTIREVFAIIQEKGKPVEQKQVGLIKERYESGEQLEFDDVMLLKKLYQSCGTCLPNKEVGDE